MSKLQKNINGYKWVTISDGITNKYICSDYLNDEKIAELKYKGYIIELA